MRFGLLITCVASFGIAALFASAADQPAVADGAEFFEKHVRPVLADNCFSCHGEQKQKAGLRLDSKSALFKGSDTKAVIVPGDPDKSALIDAILYHRDVKMPPSGKMPDEAIENLTSWVRQGAIWPADRAATSATSTPLSVTARNHWAFQPVKKPTIPDVSPGLEPLNPVDAFILAELASRGLTPSKSADRQKLIRRANFDLTGLPPTPEEVDEFINDISPNAFATLIDRLLASPAYGERWGRYWLDVARYADTKGYLFMQERRFPASYTYRDYVIRAFNEDLPYDQFILQQLAADKLALSADNRPLAAMGYLTLGRRFLNRQPDIIDDRIDVVGRGMLGLTVSCARCHDHKYDPIPTTDYYSLYGVFANSAEPSDLPLLAHAAQTPERTAFETELQSRQRQVDEYLDGKRSELAAGLRARVADLLLAARNAALPKGAQPERLFVTSELPPRIVQSWTTFLDKTGQQHHPVLTPWHAFAALSQQDFAVQAPALATKIAGNADQSNPINVLVARAFADRPPASLRDVALRYGSLFERIDRIWEESLKSADENTPLKFLPEPAQEEIRRVLYEDSTLFTLRPGEIEQLFDDGVRNKLTQLRQKVDEWRAIGPGSPPRAMVLNDKPKIEPSFVFIRGNPQNVGAPVQRQFLQVLSGDSRTPFKNGSGRLELARAIADPTNALTARVMVNRIWMHHFGAGLVRTPSDFGLRGDAPTHPQLLDYLAATFVENGWSIKDMHRIIMTSRVYQQSSDDNPPYREIDPENRYLWRTNRRRLEFEALRDSMIAVAGRMEQRVGGTPVDLTKTPSTTRRAVYGFIDRQNLPGMFRTFDFASPDTSSPQRHQTTVPQQALFLMNSPFVIEQASQVTARADLQEFPDPKRRIGRLYQILYGRFPESEEVELGIKFVNVAAGESDQKLAPWVKYVQVLLLANEFTYVD